MHFCALQTDLQSLARPFCAKEERILLLTTFHGLSAFLSVVREIVLTGVFGAVVILMLFYAVPMAHAILVFFLLWFLYAACQFLRAFVDWRYDFLAITESKVIVVNQESFFSNSVTPIPIVNVGGVTTATQFWNMFSFGMLTIHLKEGLGGGNIERRYVPRVSEVAKMLSEIVTKVQPRS